MLPITESFAVAVAMMFGVLACDKLARAVDEAPQGIRDVVYESTQWSPKSRAAFDAMASGGRPLSFSQLNQLDDMRREEDRELRSR